MSFSALTSSQESKKSYGIASSLVAINTGRGFSLATATAFIVGEVAGGGILSLPFATAQAGWSGLAMIVYCAGCAGIAGLCLAESWIILEERYPEYRDGLTRKPFATIGQHSFGFWMSVLVSILMNVTRIGASTVFLILTSNLLVALTGDFIHLTTCQWIPIVAAVLLIPFWLGSPADFWPIAYTAMISTCVGSVLLIADIIVQLTRNGPATDFHVESVEKFSGAFGTILFAFGGASAFPNFQNDMREKRRFPLAVIMGFIGLILLYLPTAGLGYTTFGHSVTPSILSSLSTGWLITVINACFFVHCITVVMIIINPVYLDLEEVLRIPKHFNWKRCLFRAGLLALMTLIGETLPSFGQILDLIGGSTVAAMAFILPPLFYVKLCWDRSNPEWPVRDIPLHMMVIYSFIVISGAVGGIASTYATLHSWQPLSTACYAHHATTNQTG